MRFRSQNSLLRAVKALASLIMAVSMIGLQLGCAHGIGQDRRVNANNGWYADAALTQPLPYADVDINQLPVCHKDNQGRVIVYEKTMGEECCFEDFSIRGMTQDSLGSWWAKTGSIGQLRQNKHDSLGGEVYVYTFYFAPLTDATADTRVGVYGAGVMRVGYCRIK